MNAPLESIEITNFRSIRSTVRIPLDAPVVLIYGPNGTGKTSVMSALELALAGSLEDLARADPNYRQHLVHRGAERGQVVLTTSGLGIKGADRYETEVTGRWSGALSRDDIRFFTERCYLAQSTLTRLLEIYQASDAKTASPLTRFVSELLRIDRHDALIDGLYPAEHLARLKHLVPGYARALDRVDALKPEIAADTRRLSTEDEAVRAIAQSAFDRAAAEGYVGPTGSIRDLEDWLSSPRDRDALNRLTALEQQLQALARRWASLPSAPADDERQDAERRATEAAASVAEWQSGPGAGLNQLIDRLRPEFPALASPLRSDPKQAYDDAVGTLGAEIDRCAATLAAEQQARASLQAATAQVTNVQARIADVNQQLSEFAGEFEGVASALAGLLPHVSGETCPVCDRNFREASDESLATHLANKIAQLTERAERLQRLSQTRVEAAEDLTRAEQEQALRSAETMSVEDRTHLSERLEGLRQAQIELAAYSASASTGSQLLQNSARATSAVAANRETNFELDGIRRSAALLRRNLDDTAPDMTDPGAQLREMQSQITEQLAGLEEARRRRETLLADIRALRDRQVERTTAQRELDAKRVELARLNSAISELNRRRATVRRATKLATTARTEIIRQVFNEALNQVWRDLFVRLAPGEPFIPQFKVPNSDSKTVAAQLETVHRSGDAGGAPAAMLSAGNLNTAALTLFLALHLTAPPRVPLLLLDDPVQSMDDVHIAQFAALLRTLSKECERQVVVAVHDRTLFDYLALELTPAEPSDKLITIELSRLVSGESLAIPTPYEHREDTIFGAA